MANVWRTPITTDANLVPADVTYMPVLCIRANLPDKLFDPANNYNSGAIRFYENADQTNELAFEVVSFTLDSVLGAGDGTCEIWVSGDSWVLSSALDTVFYVEYGSSTLTEYADTDPYGRNNVYDSNYIGVYHMEQDPSGTAPQITDSSGNSNHGTSQGSMTSSDLVPLDPGQGLDFDGVNDQIDLGDITQISGATELTLSATITFDNLNDDYAIITKSPAWGTSGPFMFWRDDNTLDGANNSLAFLVVNESNSITRVSGTDGIVNDLGVKHVNATFLGGDFSGLNLYVDGSLNSTSSAINIPSLKLNSSPVRIGGVNSNYHNGINSETRLSIIARSSFCISTEYNNQKSPQTFMSPGVTAAIGGSLISDISTTSFIYNTQTIQTIYSIITNVISNTYIINQNDINMLYHVLSDIIQNNYSLTTSQIDIIVNYVTRVISVQYSINTTLVDSITSLLSEISTNTYIATPNNTSTLYNIISEIQSGNFIVTQNILSTLTNYISDISASSYNINQSVIDTLYNTGAITSNIDESGFLITTNTIASILNYISEITDSSLLLNTTNVSLNSMDNIQANSYSLSSTNLSTIINNLSNIIEANYSIATNTTGSNLFLITNIDSNTYMLTSASIGTTNIDAVAFIINESNVYTVAPQIAATNVVKWIHTITQRSIW